MRYKSLILVCTLLVGSVASSALDERSFEEASFPGAETPAGKMLEKRIMAQALIDHGMDTSSPEAILVGVRILHENPVVNAQNAADQKSSEDQIQELKGLVEKAVEMRPDDKILAELASRIGSELEEKTRGLAGGPKRWTVNIKKGEYYLLDPRLVYDVQQEAIVSARVVASAENPQERDATVGITVARDGSAKSLYTRSVAKNKTQVRWNSGPYKAGWYVKIHHLSGPDETNVVIETN